MGILIALRTPSKIITIIIVPSTVGPITNNEVITTLKETDIMIINIIVIIITTITWRMT